MQKNVAQRRGKKRHFCAKSQDPDTLDTALVLAVSISQYFFKKYTYNLNLYYYFLRERIVFYEIFIEKSNQDSLENRKRDLRRHGQPPQLLLCQGQPQVVLRHGQPQVLLLCHGQPQVLLLRHGQPQVLLRNGQQEEGEGDQLQEEPGLLQQEEGGGDQLQEEAGLLQQEEGGGDQLQEEATTSSTASYASSKVSWAATAVK